IFLIELKIKPKNMEPKNIAKDGFFIKKTHLNLKNTAFLSLTIALKAYFSTYKSMKNKFSYLKKPDPDDENQDYYSIKYIENACEAVTHLQHFLELYIKEILENESILLAIDVKKNHSILYDIIKGYSYDKTKLEKERQLEFSESFQRVISLIKTKRIDYSKYEFILDSKEWIETVNYLRNRIAHRGIFILRYQALDFLFGKYVLPFVNEIIRLEGKENKFKTLEFYSNKGKLNVIDCITKHFEEEKYSITKVALLKEFGRACFENPVKENIGLGRNEKERAEVIADEVSKQEDSGIVMKCPICRSHSLVKYHELVDLINKKTGDYDESIEIVYNVTCYCCSLELFNDLEDIKIMNLGLEDYWKND
ncbi:MAG: hypothetical protein ACOCQD_02425, partial [archaeon]